ncbi:MAG: cation transporter [Sphingomonadales bacterium]|nr:cation transporter [Sphingomonadales bacterium]
MPHDHSHHHHAPTGEGAMAWAVAINVLLTFAQVAGGLVAGSVALIADGVHNFSDAAALVLAFGARRLARRAASASMSFGWSRAEVVAALVNYVALILIALWLMVEAAGRLADPPAVQGGIVIWLALLALVIDLGTAGLTWRLSRESLNIRAAFLHNLADAGASVAVIAGGVAIALWDLRVIDPVLTIGISIFILWHVAGDLRPILRILMLGAPEGPAPEAVAARLAAHPGVEGVHHLHLFQLDEGRSVLSAHLVIAEGQDFAAVIAGAKAMLAADFDLMHATLEPETAAQGCADRADCLAKAPAGHGHAHVH